MADTLLEVPRAVLTSTALAHAVRLGQLVASLEEGEADRSVPELDWTVRDAAAHILTLLGRAMGDNRRSRTPAETAALNRVGIEEQAALSLAELALRIDSSAPVVFEQILPQVDDVTEFPFHAGITTTVPQVIGVLLIEFLVHGDDLARATGREWVVEDQVAALALTAAHPLLRGWLADERRTTAKSFGFDVGDDAPLVFTVAERSVTLHRTPEALGAADARTRLAAGRLLLGLFGRRSIDDPIAREFFALFEPF